MHGCSHGVGLFSEGSEDVESEGEMPTDGELDGNEVGMANTANDSMSLKAELLKVSIIIIIVVYFIMYVRSISCIG